MYKIKKKSVKLQKKPYIYAKIIIYLKYYANLRRKFQHCHYNFWQNFQKKWRISYERQ